MSEEKWKERAEVAEAQLAALREVTQRVIAQASEYAIDTAGCAAHGARGRLSDAIRDGHRALRDTAALADAYTRRVREEAADAARDDSLLQF